MRYIYCVRLRRIFAATTIIFSLIFTACSRAENDDIMNLKDYFYWAETTAESEVEDIGRLRFHKFDKNDPLNTDNLSDIGQGYVWLMAVFTLPEHLSEQTLGLLISNLQLADMVWVNGIYIGGYGQSSADEKSALWGSHFYSIPGHLMNPDGRNIILIKARSKVDGRLADSIFLGKYERIYDINTLNIFQKSAIYLFAEGGMLFTAILFLFIFIWRKKEHEYLSFSMLCISSMIFSMPFFTAHLPINFQKDAVFLLFVKLTFCEGMYLLTFFLSKLVIEFTKKTTGSKKSKTARVLIFAVSSVITLAAPTYNSLIAICKLTIALSVIQLVLSFIFISRAGLEQKERHGLLVFVLAVIPFFISLVTDIIIKRAHHGTDIPLTLFGWLITICDFMILLSLRYNRTMAQNEYLNQELRQEIRKQTRLLSLRNSKLEEGIKKAQQDLEMASLVQKEFFPYPPKSLRGWDIAVSYSPLDKVSGDMYDFYMRDNNLNGFSIFDVSGHGIAASLVTMLAKNIVFQSFMRNLRDKGSVSRTLYEINKEIIDAKGDIENYLTGLMFRFGDFDEHDECKVEMANAGHPNPILYNAKANLCDEIESGDSENHHGAIGLDFITVSFPQINFSMAEDDILLFYTDGLTEGRGKDNEMFGKDRIKKIIKENYAKNAQSIMEDIIDAYKSFTHGVKRDDDITIVVMKRENSANFIEELTEA